MKEKALKAAKGQRPTGKHLSDLLPTLMEEMQMNYKDRPDLIIAAWPSIIGEKFASMARAVSFEKGVLVVKVNNSTLYSLLSQNERQRLLTSLKQQFPLVMIRNIQFRIG